MQIGESIAFGSLVLAFLGFVYKASADEAIKRKAIFDRVDKIKEATSDKIEEAKKEMDIKLQSKEICIIHNERIDATLQEIKIDVKTLLQKIK